MRAGGPVGWIINHWRLKLLSLMLSVCLLTAIAFSENPPDFASVPVRIQWLNQPRDVVILDPPSTIQVQVAGLHDAVDSFRHSAAGVSVDLATAKPGVVQTFYAIPKDDFSGLTTRESVIPIRLTTEPLATRQLDIEVRTPNKAPGVGVIAEKTYATCGNANERCKVPVQGAARIVDNLKAYVNYDVTLNSGTQSSLDEPVRYELNGRPLDKPPNTLPAPSLPSQSVTVQVATTGGTASRTVYVSALPQGTQACGYVIGGVDVQPATVLIHGPVENVSRLDTVSVDPVNISGLTANMTVTRRIQTGSTAVVADPGTVRVTITMSQLYSCAAPSPAAGALLVSPSPTGQPRPSPT